MTSTRREFLRHALAAGAMLPIVKAPWFGSVAGVKPDLPFPKDARGRLAISCWSFRAYIDSPTNQDRDPKVPGIDFRNFPAHVVEKFNVHNIEPYNWHFPSTDREYLTSFRVALDKAGVQAVNIAVDGERGFYDADADARRQAIAFAKSWVDVAVQIGSPSIRTNDPPAKNSKPDLERTVASLREVVDYAASKNVVVNLENDNLVSEDAFFNVKVIEAVNHPYLHALPDFGNSMQTGDADFN